MAARLAWAHQVAAGRVRDVAIRAYVARASGGGARTEAGQLRVGGRAQANAVVPVRNAVAAAHRHGVVGTERGPRDALTGRHVTPGLFAHPAGTALDVFGAGTGSRAASVRVTARARRFHRAGAASAAPERSTAGGARLGGVAWAASGCGSATGRRRARGRRSCRDVENSELSTFTSQEREGAGEHAQDGPHGSNLAWPKRRSPAAVNESASVKPARRRGSCMMGRDSAPSRTTNVVGAAS